MSRDDYLTVTRLSSSSRRERKKHVVIYYPTNYSPDLIVTINLFSLSIDDLLSNDAECSPLQFTLSDEFLPNYMSTICTTEGGEQPCLYVFGCQTLPLESPSDKPRPIDLNRYKKVYRYDLVQLENFPERKITSIAKQCQDTKHGFISSLVVQFSEDCIYLISCDTNVTGPGPYFDDDFDDKDPTFKAVFQEYNIKNNSWEPVDCSTDIIDTCKADVHDKISFAPHVVIDNKLHVSLGNASFTFDAINRVWQKCKLFENFWLEHKHEKTGLSPSNFYGLTVYPEFDEEAVKKSNGGPPFGFYGRGIVWNNDVLLGVHYAEGCPLVAFLLDDDLEGERVVIKSQRITEKDLCLPNRLASYVGRLVDLGENLFGLVHNVDTDGQAFRLNDPSYDPFYLELTIFKVSRIDSDDVRFLSC